MPEWVHLPLILIKAQTRDAEPWRSLNPRGLLVDHNTTHAQSILAVRRFVVAVCSPARDIELKRGVPAQLVLRPRLWFLLISNASCLTSDPASQSCLSQPPHSFSLYRDFPFISGFCHYDPSSITATSVSHVPTLSFLLVKQNCVLLAARLWN